eukprot:CAMPEP_0194477572 /NCGR_PEP_ID=MMETSP0253-20130528/1293_1 /TAXON_ID=2966 /ORGANISM="Noctiluca scintillans" /LENGTH=61 /DNA_ID=CAMNT_0039316571 /DNA_START=14 /DNA_END=199 /DNA_ORIENTATION=-
MSGRITPMVQIPTPDLAVPYAAPRLAKMMAEATPKKPKRAEVGEQSSVISETKRLLREEPK